MKRPPGSAKMARSEKDPFGAVRFAATKHCRKDPMPVGTVVVRADKTAQGDRCYTRYIKVQMNGGPQHKWKAYARWWWEKHRGPIPLGQLVLHKDGDHLNDTPSNLILGTPGTKLCIAHTRSPKWSRDQHRRAAAGIANRNRKVGRINRSRNFLRGYWYPVVDDLGVILNIPFRRRKRLLGCFGIDVSSFPANGLGKRPDSNIQKAIKESRVRAVRSTELRLGRYQTYCLLDPASKDCRGPMSITVDRLISHLDQIGIWSHAEKQAKRDLQDRK